VKKIEPPKSDTHPLSAKIIAGLRKTTGRKVVDISELRDAKITAENLKKTVITEKQLSQLDPLHGVYVYAQNKLSVIIEQLSDLPVLSKLTDAYTNAEDGYMPSGPPMSPLTKSYFYMLGFFRSLRWAQKRDFRNNCY